MFKSLGPKRSKYLQILPNWLTKATWGKARRKISLLNVLLMANQLSIYGKNFPTLVWYMTAGLESNTALMLANQSAQTQN